MATRPVQQDPASLIPDPRDPKPRSQNTHPYSRACFNSHNFAYFKNT